eukprot:gene35964-44346_t
MNYLAHIFLARQSDAAMIGAMLGDFAKANVSGVYTPEIEREIMLHRYIDSYTDSHPVQHFVAIGFHCAGAGQVEVP